VKSNPNLLDLRECAAYLGFSTDAVYIYAQQGKLPAFKLGNRWRFPKAQLDQWIEQQAKNRDQGTENREQETEKPSTSTKEGESHGPQNS
jgi:excisionase family DNA binding protein